MMIIIQTLAMVIKALAGLLCAFRLHYLKYLFKLIRRVEEKSRTNLNYHWPVIFVFIFSNLSFTFFPRSSGMVNSICQIYRFLLKFFSFTSNIIIFFEKIWETLNTWFHCKENWIFLKRFTKVTRCR